MKILLTNDDGPFAPGLCPLRHALEALGEVTVVCPAEERSGVGHAITYLAPVRAGTVRLHDGAAHTLSGTPADCVKFALLNLLGSPPDLVVSGPNLGLNLGMDVFYSGTVAAALEGGFFGVAAIALSTSRENDDRMDAVVAQAVRVLRALLKSGMGHGAVFNVNIPPLDGAEPELRVTRQDPRLLPEQYRRYDGARGRVHYFLDLADAEPEPGPVGSDAAALQDGAISVTPLRCNLTDEAGVARLSGILTPVRAKT
jgi:5'-nucleotidase